MNNRVVVSKYKDNPDKIIADIEKQDLKIANFRTTMTDKSEGKDVCKSTLLYLLDRS